MKYSEILTINVRKDLVIFNVCVVHSLIYIHLIECVAAVCWLMLSSIWDTVKLPLNKTLFNIISTMQYPHTYNIYPLGFLCECVCVFPIVNLSTLNSNTRM